MRFLAIDPGDVHVGFTLWQDDRCLEAQEFDPEQCIEVVADYLYVPGPWPSTQRFGNAGPVDLVVCERFMLYGWKMAPQMGSEFKTAQLIGQIKLLCRMAKTPFVGQMASEGKSVYSQDWYLALTNKERRQLAWYGKGSHVRDAWVHGVKYLQTQGLWDEKMLSM